jgi:hypothetical protein
MFDSGTGSAPQVLAHIVNLLCLASQFITLYFHHLSHSRLMLWNIFVQFQCIKQCHVDETKFYLFFHSGFVGINKTDELDSQGAKHKL